MKQPSESWNEFDWEKALRESDNFAKQYFSLLKRFCDLPGGNQLIAKHLEKHFGDSMPHCNLNCDKCSDRWDCEFAANMDWLATDYDESNEEELDEIDEELFLMSEENQEEIEEILYYETDPAFVTLRQAAIGWSNIYAAVIPKNLRKDGLKVLFHIGRALANFSISLGDEEVFQPNAAIAFGKRASSNINAAIGIINDMKKQNSSCNTILSSIIEHLLKANDCVIDHIQKCREMLNKDKK